MKAKKDTPGYCPDERDSDGNKIDPNNPTEIAQPLATEVGEIIFLNINMNVKKSGDSSSRSVSVTPFTFASHGFLNFTSIYNAF